MQTRYEVLSLMEMTDDEKQSQSFMSPPCNPAMSSNGKKYLKTHQPGLIRGEGLVLRTGSGTQLHGTGNPLVEKPVHYLVFPLARHLGDGGARAGKNKPLSHAETPEALPSSSRAFGMDTRISESSLLHFGF